VGKYRLPLRLYQVYDLEGTFSHLIVDNHVIKLALSGQFILGSRQSAFLLFLGFGAAAS
jgi:hypothetical protein